MRIAIIGAGMAGLSCARVLADAGLSPIVFDKSRGLGGRLATRRADTLRFDHGAQFVTARGDDFRAYLTEHAKPWRPEGGGEWYVGVPAMNALVKPMADGIDIRLGEAVEPQQVGTGWQVGDEHVDLIISTVPVVQARALFPQITDSLAEVDVAPCWTLMVAFDEATDWPQMWRSRDADLGWMEPHPSRN